MSLEHHIRPGLAGYWDRFVGPQASRAERAGILATMSAAARWGAVSLGTDGSARAARMLTRVMAVDLWGGAWVNNTRSCVRWYERPGQGAPQHLRFAVLHLLHPAVIAWVDQSSGTRSRGSAIVWAMAHYGWMLATSTAITISPRRSRLAIAIAATSAGIYMDRRLGPSKAAPWFTPVYYTKLLIGHAAGSLWNASRVSVGAEI